VNSTAVTSAFDMGHDGAAGSMVAKDVFGLALHYYGNNEYSPVNNTLTPFAAVSGLTSLFNGNISAISQNLPSLGNPLLYSYNYDVLNRLKKMQASNGLNKATNTWTPVALSDYKESISYDANGNILTYDRYGNKAAPNKQMDSLSYNYRTGTNKLDFIKDDIAATNYDNDIDNQLIGNYDYDAVGNLVKDSAGGIQNIRWNVYGKIAAITKTDGTTISYTYDVAGNRVSKTVNGIQTWYVRDASGNVMSVYTKGDNAINSGTLSQTETHLYGSSRLGINTLNTNMESGVTPVTVNLTGLGSGFNINFIRGKKFFELSNHLGNVLATVSDKKTSIFTGSVFDHYDAAIVSSQEYYPFGMQMPERGFSSSKYRYGFNGKENDNEVKGEGNQQDYGLRVYDPRLGRFFSVDPLAPKYPELTPYQFASNTPMQAVDLDGGEANYIIQNGRKWAESMSSDNLRHQIPANAYIPSLGAAEYGAQNGAQTGMFIVGSVFVVAKAPAVLSAVGRGISFGWKWYVNGGHTMVSAATGDASAAFGPSAAGATGVGIATYEIAARDEAISSEVTYFRVQGGTPPKASRNLISVNEIGNVKVKNTTLNISAGDGEHVEHFLKLRPEASVVKFKVPGWFDDFLKEYAIPQAEYSKNPANQGGLAPKLVDPTTPGTSYELPPIWTQWINENAVKGSGEVIKPQ
ncbi:RHS repeat-associated core domain-containing protein, partial [Chitinophaga oryziterrae]